MAATVSTSVRDGLRRTTLEFARWLSLPVAGLFCVIFVFNLLDLPEGARTVVALHDTFIVAACVSIWFLVSRGRFPPTHVHPVMALMAVVIASNVLLTMSLQEEPFYLVYIIVLIMALSFFILSRRWFVIAVVAIVLGWLPPALLSTPGRQLFYYGFALAVATAVSAVLQRLQRHTRIGMEELRLLDAQHKQDLTTALATLERQLAEREAAERDRARLEDQLRQAQKLEAIGTLVGGIVHDFNNMLAVIVGTASSMREEDLTPEQIQEDAGEILDAARRASDLTRNLLGFARQGDRTVENVDLAGVVTDVMQLVQRTIPKKIAVRTVIATREAVFRGDAHQIGQALMNLCINGVHAMGDEGTLTLSLDLVELGEADCPAGVAPGRFARVRVEDTGTGMPAHVVARAFDPFFTTKARGEGTGLGLAMVYGTVARHGGIAVIDSEPGRGTTVSVLLPTVDEAATPHADENAPWPRGTGTVLVVDDEEYVRQTVRRILERLGYTVLVAKNGAAGVEMYRSHAHIDLVLLDVAMPIMDGTECFTQLVAHDPDARVLVTSGFAQDGAVQGLLNRGAVGFVAKPFDGRQLARAIAAGISR